MFPTANASSKKPVMRVDSPILPRSTALVQSNMKKRREDQMGNSGLVRVRTFGSMSRRSLLKGAAGLSALSAVGLPHGQVRAAGAVSMFGWQDYDAGLRVGDFLQREGIEVSFTPIGNNDEIIIRLSAGGAGQIDIVTPYKCYIPLMVAAVPLEPIDDSKILNFAPM